MRHEINSVRNQFNIRAYMLQTLQPYKDDRKRRNKEVTADLLGLKGS